MGGGGGGEGGGGRCILEHEHLFKILEYSKLIIPLESYKHRLDFYSPQE